MDTPLLALKGIKKSFPGVVALKGVDFQVEKGKIHALLGSNGAGKTTLVNIICGVVKRDAGEIFWEGKKIDIVSPRQAHNLGIAYVTQELSLFDKLTVKENIVLGAENSYIKGRIARRLKWREIANETKHTLSLLGYDIDVNTVVSALSFGEKQIVEIARALFRKARLLILDEPTSGLTAREVHRLFDVLRKLRDAGCSVIYITHRLEEIFDLADEVTVMRDGMVIQTKNTKETNKEELIRLMTGREILYALSVEKRLSSQKVLLAIKRLSTDYLKNVSLELHVGEILGLAGLPDSGVTELMECLVGAREYNQGEIFVSGRNVMIRSPSDAIAHGLFYVPKDRRKDGLFLSLSLKENVVSAKMNQQCRFGIILTKFENRLATDLIYHLNITPPVLNRTINVFSGGNQQKAVIARALKVQAKVLILNDPMRGIDVGAKAEISEILRKLAFEGRGIILTSSELDELLLLCDRIIVLHRGRVVGEYTKGAYSKDKIMHCMFSGQPMWL